MSLQASTAPRRRTAAACQACHTRKVRCSLAKSGPPCTNCVMDEKECEPRANRRRRLSIIQHRPAAPQTPQSSVGVGAGQDLPVLNTRRERANLGIAEAIPVTEAGKAAGSTVDTSGVTSPEFTSHLSHYGIIQTEAASTSRPSTPIYGDPGGITLVTDVSHPDWLDKSGHLFLRKAKGRSLGDEELNYLHKKGAFTFPKTSVCEALVRSYFHHVHPFFPIINAKPFLVAFEGGQYERIGIHLLWSVFLAASLFASEDTLRDGGFATRKAMKWAMYQKAKALYDMQYERSKTTLIQSVLLMGFWYADTQDRTGPLHWIGVAISLCQSAGLHRKSSLAANRSTTDTSVLWRQLWWACVYRDAWYAVGQGKPMRIDLADCNTDMPSVEDCKQMSHDVEEALRGKYLPASLDLLSQLWVDLLKLTVVLIEIATALRRDGGPGDSDALAQKEQEVLACRQSCISLMQHTDRILQIHIHHVELYSNSVLIVLYRPRVLHAKGRDPRDTQTSLDLCIAQRTQEAATRINGVLAQLIAADAIGVCQGIICMALIPAMQIHMLNHLSKDPLARQLNHHQFEICMMVMQELKKTYFGAEIISKIFENAKAQIQPQVLALENCGSNAEALVPSSSRVEGVPVTVAGYSDHFEQSDDTTAIFQNFMRQHDYFDMAELDSLDLEPEVLS